MENMTLTKFKALTAALGYTFSETKQFYNVSRRDDDDQQLVAVHTTTPRFIKLRLGPGDPSQLAQYALQFAFTPIKERDPEPPRYYRLGGVRGDMSYANLVPSPSGKKDIVFSTRESTPNSITRITAAHYEALDPDQRALLDKCVQEPVTDEVVPKSDTPERKPLPNQSWSAIR